MDDEDGGGIIVSDGPVEYNDFNIPNTVEHFRIGGRPAVLGFYHQLVKPSKQGWKKLGIVYVLCVNSLEGTDYDQWTWVKCMMVSINNTTNLLSHLEERYDDIASVK
jgi:hypothetical protein